MIGRGPSAPFVSLCMIGYISGFCSGSVIWHEMLFYFAWCLDHIKFSTSHQRIGYVFLCSSPFESFHFINIRIKHFVIVHGGESKSIFVVALLGSN
jgi:hypothetical protein